MLASMHRIHLVETCSGVWVLSIVVVVLHGGLRE